MALTWARNQAEVLFTIHTPAVTQQNTLQHPTAYHLAAAESLEGASASPCDLIWWFQYAYTVYQYILFIAVCKKSEDLHMLHAIHGVGVGCRLSLAGG